MTIENLLPDFEKRGGLVVAIAKEYRTGKILMQAYMNQEAYEATQRDGIATYWSTSRNELWPKGTTSGDVQVVKELYVDCDLDAVILTVEQQGKGACHTGEFSCFYRKVADYRSSGEKARDLMYRTLGTVWKALTTPPDSGWFPTN